MNSPESLVRPTMDRPHGNVAQIAHFLARWSRVHDRELGLGGVLLATLLFVLTFTL